MGNMMLAAYSLNLGSIWIHRAKEEFETSGIPEIIKRNWSRRRVGRNWSLCRWLC